MQGIEDKVLELSEKVYDGSATPEEREAFFKLLNELVSGLKNDLKK